ncbi:EAL domain-containing protein [Vibrio fortis]|uniref:EAL domain-containing protein n=1 Tax=Vibrio fortis TaxID=212667 RepID=UPI0038CD1484
MIRFNYNSRVFEICFENYVISSAYQELRNELGHVYGHEALCRIKESGIEVAPCKFFEYLKSRSFVEMVELNMLIVNMHLKGFRYSSIYDSRSKLFINMVPSFFKIIYQNEEVLQSLVRAILIEDIKLHQLVLEITESPCPIDDLIEFYLGVDKLRSKGILIAIDDFGTGHSDFSRVAAIKPHYVKVSRELLLYSQIFKNNELRKLAALSQTENITLVYEGIEYLEQYEFAKSNGARLYQGYLLSKPVHHAISQMPCYF